MKSAIYSRKSIFTGKGESIENQVQLCKEYALKIGISDFFIYEDEGFSGKSTERPEYQKMLKDAKAKKFDCIICYRLDRISRNIADFSTLIQELQKLDIGFISIREQFDTSTPLGRAMMYIASVFAQLERETIAERVRDNMMQLAKSGRWLGGKPPYGFIIEPIVYKDSDMKERKMFKLSPNAEEIKIVKLIYDKYIEFNSIFKVAKYLEMQNIKLKNYKQVNPAFIGDILRNPVYATASEETMKYFSKFGVVIEGNINNSHGLMAYNRTDGKKNKKDISEWIISVGKHTGVIPGGQWVAAQDMKEKNSQTPPNLGNCNIVALTGLLRCSKCGSPMNVLYGNKRTDGSRHYYYKCSNRILNVNNCDNPNIRAEVIEDIVINKLKKLSASRKTILKELNKNKRLTDNTELVIEIDNINKTIIKNETAINNLVEQMTLLSLDASKFHAKKIEELTKKNRDLKKQLLDLEEKKQIHDITETNSEILIQSLLNFSLAIDNCETPEERKDLFTKVIELVTYDGIKKDVKVKLLKV
jgi:site-specific DNA recombinase